MEKNDILLVDGILTSSTEDKITNHKRKLALIGVLGVITVVLFVVDYNLAYVEPEQTKAKMQARIAEMLQTNKTYLCFNCGNYIDGVGMASFQYYEGRMHHGSMTFQDPYGRILCCNSDRNYQYFKEIMGDL